MKKTILLLCALPVFVFTGYSQTAPKGTTKIFVRDTLTMDQNYVLVMRKLIDDGYEIAKTEREFGLITTATQDIKGINGVYYLYFSVKDKEIVVRGKMKVNVQIDFGAASSTPEYSQIENTGGRGSADKIAFEAMDKIAKSLGGKAIMYEIKESK